MARQSRTRSSSLTAAASAAALLSAPSPARALDNESLMVSPGLAFSVSFGRKIEVGFTLDLRLMVLLAGEIDQRGDSTRRGVGIYGQVGWFSESGWRFGSGVHGGTEVGGKVAGIEGEAGWTYQSRYRQVPGTHGLHLGVLGQLSLGPRCQPYTVGIQVPLAVEIPVSEPVRGSAFLAGAGVRFPSIFGFQGTCIIAGRPLRDGGDILLPGVIASGARRRRLHDRDASYALANAWLDDARAECASVPAFVALARDLASVGAPPALTRGALSAVRDEMRHMNLCAEIAGGFAGAHLMPLLPAPPVASDSDRSATLRRLAVEAWSDGCVGEGAAAARAALAAHTASDQVARTVLAAIAVDEARHAELAWRVLSFALAAGGPDVREVIAELVRDSQSAPRCEANHEADPALLKAHGRLSDSDAGMAWYAVNANARRRAARLLASQ